MLWHRVQWYYVLVPVYLFSCVPSISCYLQKKKVTNSQDHCKSKSLPAERLVCYLFYEDLKDNN